MEVQLEQADIQYWQNIPYWSIENLVFLIHGYEPALLTNQSEIPDDSLAGQLARWRLWAKGCPGIRDSEMYPMTTRIEKLELIRWATTLHGIELPDWMLDLLEPQKTPKRKQQTSDQLGDREKQNLLTTIGALALALAKTPGGATGDAKNPNYSGIARSCIKACGEIPGMSISSIRDRISEGVSVLRDR